MIHGALAQGLSGKWWCTDCLLSAETPEQLRKISCHGDWVDDYN